MIPNLEVVPVPRFPIKRIRFVATVMDRFSQGAQACGCAHQAQDGSASVFIAACRLAKLVTAGLDFTNQTPGVGQVRDRLQRCERVRDQLKRFDDGV